jgi:membrane protein DedA with SNARE-associated domain
VNPVLDVRAVDSTPGAAELLRHSRRLKLLLAPVVAMFVVRGIGIALAPALLERAPVALFLMAPLGRHLVLISPDLDLGSFIAVGMLGYFMIDPFTYLLGREYGQAAVDWVERRSGVAGRWVRWVDRLFRRAAPVVLFVTPGPFVNLLAGAAKMRVPIWLALNLGGTLMAVMVMRYFGSVLESWIGAARAFVEANVTELTLASISIVVVSTLLRRRKLRRLAAEAAALDVEPAVEVEPTSARPG